ncbi:MAG: 50S ribosomal protein L21 [Chloroflexota bacterium]|nr:50S ribosomal protein L21 [Chloroflexota bacterium]
MYAVVRSNGKQYKVAVGDEIQLEALGFEPGETVELGEVLMIVDGDDVRIGKPTVAGATVRATVVSETRGPKIEIFKFKAKKRYRKHQGHRQTYTRVKVNEIAAEGISARATDVQDIAAPQAATEESEA